MIKVILLLSILCFTIQSELYARPQISFDELMVLGELDPEQVHSARNIAISQGKPVTIMTTDRIMIDVKGVENGRPVYLVFTDFADVYNGGYTAYYEEVVTKINFRNARIDYGNMNIVDNTNGYFDPVLTDRSAASKFLLAVESTNDRVYIFNADNGDLIDTAFIPQTRPQLITPKVALQHFNGEQILICDQLSDVVQLFNLNGTYNSVFAPIGGPIVTIADNMRGMRYRPNNNIVVSVGSGTNGTTIQQFGPTGLHLGTYISGNMNTPFDICIRANDVLVSNFSGTNRVSRFDTSGVFISSFYTGSNFGISQQIHELPNGFVTVAAFQTPTGLAVLDASGAFIKLLTGVTGNRGQHLLGNGNFLVTNATGIHEIDSSTGSFIRTVSAATNFQYVSDYNISNPILKLVINYEACAAEDTATVEVRSSTSPFGLIESATSTGGLSQPRIFHFSSLANGIPYYLTVKHRSSIATWSGATPSFNSNYLSYNFTYASTQALGSNQINVDGKWSLYTGDVNQDATVDLTDIVTILNDASNFASGYLVTDVNCNSFVDLADVVHAFNNSSNFVGVIQP